MTALLITLLTTCILLGHGPAFANHPVRERDSVPMVNVAEGSFIRGSSMEAGRADERPRRTIYLSAFMIDQYEVTNAQYLKFIAATGHKEPLNVYGTGSLFDVKGIGNVPVVQVTWHDAADYCQWVGKRLPTEAEWEKAARGTDGRSYPWGDKAPSLRHVNFNRDWAATGTLLPVGSLPAGVSPYGVHDMSGNAREWVQDWYAKDYYRVAPDRNPKGPETGLLKVIRGGSWHSFESDIRTAARGKGGFALKTHGTGFPLREERFRHTPTCGTRATMNVVIVGGTGFIGRNVAPILAGGGHVVTILTRNPRAASAGTGDDVRVREWDPADWQTLERAFQGQDAVINLAGAPVADRRWTPSRKHVLRASRIETTRTIVTALSRVSAPVRPTIFVSSSGIGFYGLDSNDVDEMQGPGTGFLADLCVEWEREAFRATDYGIRTTCLRISMVLGKDGGALQKMLLPFRLFLGGPIGQGTQPVSWIHVEDLGRLVAAILEQPSYKDAINAASPHPVPMTEFCRQLGWVLGRPSWLPVPAWVLQLGLGELSTLMTHGQSVNPRVAQQMGFAFNYPDLESALSALLGKDG